jgi:hypothetical protein
MKKYLVLFIVEWKISIETLDTPSKIILATIESTFVKLSLETLDTPSNIIKATIESTFVKLSYFQTLINEFPQMNKLQYSKCICFMKISANDAIT